MEQPSSNMGGEERAPTRGLPSWVLPGIVVIVVAAIYYTVQARWTTRAARSSHDAFQCFVVLCIWGIVRYANPAERRRFNEPDGRVGTHCTKCIEQFTKAWEWLWGIWTLFYLGHLVRSASGPERYWPVVFDFGEILQSVTFLILFWTMWPGKVDERGKWYHLEKHDIPAIVLIIVLAVAGGIVVHVFKVPGGPFITAVLIGILGAASMGIFIGRLESTFLDVGFGELLALYLYAATQPIFRLTIWVEEFFPNILPDDARGIEFILKTFALGTKVWLFLIVKRQLVTGRMAFYMWKVRRVSNKTELAWRRFEDRYLKPSPGAGQRITAEHGAGVDFLILTPLEEERLAVLRKLPGHRRLDTGADALVYYAAEIGTQRKDEACYRLIVTSLAGMGPTSAAIATSTAVKRWKPRYFLVVGIAGGLKDQVALGDVIVASSVASYTNGKQREDGSREKRWEQFPPDAGLLHAANNYADGFADLVSVPCPEGSTGPKRHTGVMASGGDVIASATVIADYCRDLPKLIGVEMEGGGAAAAVHANEQRPGFLMIRGVSDLADGEGNAATKARWRAYAADAAAAYAVGLLRHGPVPEAQHGAGRSAA